MTKIPESSEIYLDTSFLAPYLLAPHQKYQEAQKLMARLLIGSNRLVLSALVLDETMNVIKEVMQSQEDAANLKKGKNHKDYISDIRKAVDTVIQNSNFRITQFNDEISGCSKAVDNIDNFTLRPRDAFHLSYMQDQSIDYIVAGDKKFDKIHACKNIEF